MPSSTTSSSLIRFVIKGRGSIRPESIASITSTKSCLLYPMDPLIVISLSCMKKEWKVVAPVVTNTLTIVPLGRVHAMAVSIVGPTPAQSMTRSTPSGLSSLVRISTGRLSLIGSNVTVAPISEMNCLLSGDGSETATCVTPLALSPTSTAAPMGPAPIIRAVVELENWSGTRLMACLEKLKDSQCISSESTVHVGNVRTMQQLEAQRVL